MIRSIIGILSLVLLSCNVDKSSKEVKVESKQKINILTQIEPQSEYMEALTKGTLIIDSNGSLKLGENTIIWPYGFRLGKNKDAIYNSEGKIVVEIGNYVQFNGGECSDCPKEHIKELIGTTPDDKYHGNYWIVGDEIVVK